MDSRSIRRNHRHPELVRDLLAGFLPREWVAELDLATLERWPESRVSDGLRQRHQDRVWRVRFRDRRSATSCSTSVAILAPCPRGAISW